MNGLSTLETIEGSAFAEVGLSSTELSMVEGIGTLESLTYVGTWAFSGLGYNSKKLTKFDISNL